MTGKSDKREKVEERREAMDIDSNSNEEVKVNSDINGEDLKDIKKEDELSILNQNGTKGKSSIHKSIKEELIDTLSGEEIKELLLAKEALDGTKRILEEKDVLIKEYEDLLKRQQAEFENYRKRNKREMEENKKYANAEIILDTINVLDDFGRAIDSSKSSRDFDALLEGILIIEKQLMGILENKYGVKRIEAVGKEFDPSMHDAIMMEESDKVKEDTVVEDFQKGYIMYDRIIRPSKVKVAKAVSSSENPVNFNNDSGFDSGDLDIKEASDTTINEDIEKNNENISEKGE